MRGWGGSSTPNLQEDNRGDVTRTLVPASRWRTRRSELHVKTIGAVRSSLRTARQTLPTGYKQLRRDRTGSSEMFG